MCHTTTASLFYANRLVVIDADSEMRCPGDIRSELQSFEATLFDSVFYLSQ